MKNFLTSVIIGSIILILTGCYTRVATSDETVYTYSEPVHIIIIEPTPPPPVIINPIICYPPPKRPEYIVRNPKDDRESGNNERIRDDIRNSGGRNSDGRRSRQ